MWENHAVGLRPAVHISVYNPERLHRTACTVMGVGTVSTTILADQRPRPSDANGANGEACLATRLSHNDVRSLSTVDRAQASLKPRRAFVRQPAPALEPGSRQKRGGLRERVAKWVVPRQCPAGVNSRRGSCHVLC